MDKLLYKIWDREQKCWIEESTHDNGIDMTYVITSDGCVQLLDFDDCGNRSLNEHYIDSAPGRFDILLWAGKKDKAGDDIYDGHLLKCKWEGTVAVVVRQGAQFEALYTSPPCHPGGPRRVFDMLRFTSPMCTIVGHVHTNPGLLKEAK